MSTMIETVLSDHIAEDWTGEEPLKERSERLGAYGGQLMLKREQLTKAEQHAYELLSKEIDRTTLERSRVEIARKNPGWSILDLAPLGWTRDLRFEHHIIKVPVFALQPLHEECVRIGQPDDHYGYNNERTAYLKPTGYPGEIRAHYRECLETLKAAEGKHRDKNWPRHSSRGYTRARLLWLEWQFRHAMPDHVRETIKEVAPTRTFEAMYLMCETTPDEWKVANIQLPKPELQMLDPLLVGWAEGALWILDQFDPTPMETYIASEFALPAPQYRELTTGS